MQKVLVFNLTPRFGMLHYSAQFCNALAKRYQVSVAIADYYKGDLYDEAINLVKIKTNPDLKSFIFDSLHIFQHRRFLKEIARIKPDIIHFMDNHPWYIFYAKRLKRAWYKVYVTQHDPTLHSGDSKWLQGKIAVLTNKVLRILADKLIVHGENLKADLIEQYQVNPEKIIVVPHGNYNFFTRRSGGTVELRENAFLFFGRIVDYKGLDLLLESLEFVKKKVQNFTLIIAWSWNTDKYKQLLGCYWKYIQLYNKNISDEEVRKYFEMSEFIVLPYKDATGSWVLPVAFAFSKPVIVSDAGELGTCTKSANWGMVLDFLTPQTLAEQIIWMLEHKDEARNLGKNGRKYTEEVLGWEKIVAAIYR